MPNWCSNSIEIAGDAQTIACIKYAVENVKKDNDKGVFKALIGIPSNMSDEQYESDWYDTNVSYYGTKWDVDYDDGNWDFDKENIHFSCDTAWSPPINFLYNLMMKYPGLTYCEIIYDEPGVDFAGKTSITRDADGIHMEDDECTYEEGLYKYQNDYFWDKIADDIDNFVQDFEGDDEDLIKKEFLQNLPFITEIERNEVLDLLDEAIGAIKETSNTEKNG